MLVKFLSVRRLLPLLFLIFFASFGFAQNKLVTGKVVANENDSSLVGATVQIKGTAMTTVTAKDGTFSLNAPPNALLIISSIGFTTQEVAVNNQSVLNIRLVIDPQSLQQIVVIGYGTVKRKDVTGAVSSVTAAQIAKVPVTTLDQALQGSAPGVQVINNDASPGGNVSVLIRGIGSLASGGNNPLYVVDGYPTTGGINNINPK